MNKMIWVYMLNLSNHMWGDEKTIENRWYLDPPYREENGVDIDVWDEIVRFLAERKYNTVLIDVGDGIRYESHPEISAPDAWDKELLKKKLLEMRALGITPIPKLNFSTCHDTWLKEYRRMISTPTYYKVCADLIAEVCEVFGSPHIFHLGMDEEGTEMQKSYEMTIVRGESLWWHDLFFLFKECEKHSARPWVWSDYSWHHEALFFEKMPKSVLQSSWLYLPFKDYPKDSLQHKRIEIFETLDKNGYDQILTGSLYNNLHNMNQNVAFGKDRLTAGGLTGFMAASWMATTHRDRFTLLDNAERMYLARKKFYPETL